MVTRKANPSTIQQRHRLIVKEIEKKFGRVIDLERSPMVLVEIIREFRHRFDDDGGGGGGGVSPSSIAGSGPPDPPEEPPSARSARAARTGRSGHETTSHHAERHKSTQPETG